jgi:chromosome segregation ATPase
MTEAVQIIATIIGAIGGWEAIRYLLNWKTNGRREEAETDSVEFKVLSEAVEFLQKQLKDKEERFAQQTDLLRKANAEILEITKEKGQLELDLQRYKCVVQKCPNREPQNGY